MIMSTYSQIYKSNQNTFICISILEYNEYPATASTDVSAVKALLHIWYTNVINNFVNL